MDPACCRYAAKGVAAAHGRLVWWRHLHALKKGSAHADKGLVSDRDRVHEDAMPHCHIVPDAGGTVVLSQEALVGLDGAVVLNIAPVPYPDASLIACSQPHRSLRLQHGL